MGERTRATRSEATKSPVASYRHDLRNGSTECSQEMVEICGLPAGSAPSWSQLMDLPCGDGDSLDRARSVIEYAEQTGNLVVGAFRIVRDDDKAVRTILASAQATLDESGSAGQLSGQLVDITDDFPAGDDVIGVVTLGPVITLILVGTVDTANHADLAQELDRALLLTDGDLHLELSRLSFIDLTGVQIISDAAWKIAPDRRLVCAHPPWMFTRILELFTEIGRSRPTNLLVDNGL